MNISSWIVLALVAASSAHAGELFSNRDDISLVSFVSDPSGEGRSGGAELSPDGRQLVIATEQGDLERDRLEIQISVFNAADIEESLLHRRAAPRPKAVTISSEQGWSLGAGVLRWTSDARELLLLVKKSDGTRELRKIQASSGVVSVLSLPGQDVTEFDERAGTIVYSVSVPRAETDSESRPLIVVGTGKGIADLVIRGKDSWRSVAEPLNELWLHREGKVSKIVDRGGSVVRIRSPYRGGAGKAFWLDPAGKHILALTPVRNVPDEWQAYTTRQGAEGLGIHPGVQRIDDQNVELLERFSVIDVSDGSVAPALDAPAGRYAGFGSQYAIQGGSWSHDGSSVVLTNTFLPISADRALRTPCVAVVEIATGKSSCVMRFSADATKLAGMGIHRVLEARFEGRGSSALVMEVLPLEQGRALRTVIRSLHFRRLANGSWREEGKPQDRSSEEVRSARLVIRVEQSLDSPPKLIVTDVSAGTHLTLMDPNVSISRLHLGDTRVYRWKDKRGAEWIGGLLLPPGFASGRQYPLVIQTHGFQEGQFLSTGPFSGAGGMAGRALAAHGIVVLQVGSPSNGYETVNTPYEGLQQSDGFDAAVDQLSAEHVIDPERVGLVGFSRTVFGVLEALTEGKTRFAAATIADGVKFGYFDYLLNVDNGGGTAGLRAAEAVIGAKPFGAGLQTWVQRSPGFVMDNVHTPLRVESYSPGSALFMWQPYAALRALGRPTDFIIINSDEHVQTRPRARLASQDGAVDWFRFWLQGYEDPNPAKAEQYQRWRKMKESQSEQKPPGIAVE